MVEHADLKINELKFCQKCLQHLNKLTYLLIKSYVYNSWGILIKTGERQK